ncbi:MAG: hypothetical protein ACTHL4_14250, partial [Flexivirga sp.]
MVWLILALIIVVLAVVLWLLLRDPKGGRSVGIDGVTSDHKLSSAEPAVDPGQLASAAPAQDSVDTHDEPATSVQPAASASITESVAEPPAKPAAEPAPEPVAEPAADDWDAPPPALEETPAATSAGDDWDAPPPALEETPAATSAGDDWDTPPPAL